MNQFLGCGGCAYVLKKPPALGTRCPECGQQMQQVTLVEARSLVGRRRRGDADADTRPERQENALMRITEW